MVPSAGKHRSAAKAENVYSIYDAKRGKYQALKNLFFVNLILVCVSDHVYTSRHLNEIFCDLLSVRLVISTLTLSTFCRIFSWMPLAWTRTFKESTRDRENIWREV